MERWKLSVLAGLAVIGLGIAGCGNKPEAVESGNTTKASPSAPKTPEPPKPKATDLPASLKTDAFEYYGLGFEGEMKLELKKSSEPTVITGSQTISLKEIKGDSAIFVMSRTDGLAQTGDMEFLVKADGVYVTRVGTQEINPPKLEIPADLTEGKTWTTDSGFKVGSQMIKENAKYKVGKVEKITIGKETMDALVVTADGTTSVDQVSMQTKFTSWLVKGKGAVKTVVETAGLSGPSKGKKETITVQWVP